MSRYPIRSRFELRPREGVKEPQDTSYRVTIRTHRGIKKVNVNSKGELLGMLLAMYSYYNYDDEQFNNNVSIISDWKRELDGMQLIRECGCIILEGDAANDVYPTKFNYWTHILLHEMERNRGLYGTKYEQIGDNEYTLKIEGDNPLIVRFYDEAFMKGIWNFFLLIEENPVSYVRYYHRGDAKIQYYGGSRLY